MAKRKNQTAIHFHRSFDRSMPLKVLVNLLEQYTQEMNSRSGEMDFCLETAGLLIAVGVSIEDSHERENDDPVLRKCESLDKAFTKALESDSLNPPLRELRKEHGFDTFEMKIMMMLIASSLGVCQALRDVDDVQRHYPNLGPSKLDIARLFLPDSRLVASGMIILHRNQPFKDSRLEVSQELVEPILKAQGKLCAARWECETQDDLLFKLWPVRDALTESGSNVMKITSEDTDFPEGRVRDRLVKMFMRSIKSGWPIEKLIQDKFSDRELRIVLTLLAVAALGRKSYRPSYSSDSTDLYSGDGLSMAAADDAADVTKVIKKCFMPGSRLLENGVIRAIGRGLGNTKLMDEDTVREFDYELTDEYLEQLGIKRKRQKNEVARTPLVTMDQLVLPGTVREAVELAANQYQCRAVLEKWDVGASISYGQAVTVLFSGPPGVGKTATAEAMAHMLGKRILVADYSRIQSCWVGETEKNISRMFCAATDSDAVLFWDEADAMFFDRDSAERNFEVRDINVLLQQLEAFTGVCILATNRKIVLDKALARRISLKVDFGPPTSAVIRSIWEKLLPSKMPLADDVDLDALARHTLTGGEIKNIVLNAARRAAGRGMDAVVAMADFQWAIDTELSGKDFSGLNGRTIGFASAKRVAT